MYVLNFPDADDGSFDDGFPQYLAFASFTVLIWDHLITFDREVVYIWPARKNLCAFWLCRCWNKG